MTVFSALRPAPMGSLGPCRYDEHARPLNSIEVRHCIDAIVPFLKKYPKEAYMTEVERRREPLGHTIEFTMRRLASAD